MLILALHPSSVVTLENLDELADVVGQCVSNLPKPKVQDPVCKGSPYTDKFLRVLYAQQCFREQNRNLAPLKNATYSDNSSRDDMHIETTYCMALSEVTSSELNRDPKTLSCM